MGMQALQCPPDANRTPKWTSQGEEHFPHGRLQPGKNKNTDISVNPGSADTVSVALKIVLAVPALCFRKLEKAGAADFKKHTARKVGTRSRQC